MATEGKFQLTVPLDASKVEGFKPEQKLKVAVLDAQNQVLASRTVAFDAKGNSKASFSFDKAPGTVRVIVAPADAADDVLQGLDTLSVIVDRRGFLKPSLQLKPIVISTFWWRSWLRWCRTFTVEGRIVCADGRPVPGAKVCAFDVDNWWWWSSLQQVGCATTDGNGEFKLQFRWCCGWLPWWWWRLRDWRLDEDLAQRLTKLVQSQGGLRLPRPQPQPDPAIFDVLLGGPRRSMSGEADSILPSTSSLTAGAARLNSPLDLTRLNGLREKLLVRLPQPTDGLLQQLWPWAPFEPWRDCTPDLTFRVTQQCEGQERLIVNEPWWRTRWNVSTDLSVTLVANDLACCTRDVPNPPENCAVPFSVCGVQSFDIGGNLGAPVAPAGFANPGDTTVTADAPWASMLRIGGDVGCDYYGFEVATNAIGPYAPVSVLSAGGFSRLYWDSPSASFQNAPFPFQTLDGHNVCESRQHYEATHFPGDWGTGNNHIWLGSEFETLMLWSTAGNYNNGTHHLRLRGFDEVAGHLQGAGTVLQVCGTQAPNAMVLALDNRLPATLAREPRADVVVVRIGGAEAGPCSNVAVKPTDGLEIDFIAYDVDGHLSEYMLAATYGKNLAVNLLGLLGLPGVTLAPISLDGEPAALQVGPSYPVALVQGAVRPVWAGGGLRLTVPPQHFRKAFPITCCYQIELWALKRTIDNCDGSRPHRAFSFYSLTVNV